MNGLTMNKEFEALVPLSPSKKMISNKWAFLTKILFDKILDKYIYRVASKGYHQSKSMNCTKTFSPFVKPTTINIVFSIVLTYAWFIRKIEIKNAFLNEGSEEEVYIT